MGARVTIAMSVFNQLALTRACLESLRATTEPFRLVVIDNGSTDDTARVFERFEYPYPLRFERNGENRPVIATLNRAWRLAETDYVCVLHNDTELADPGCLGKLVDAFGSTGNQFVSIPIFTSRVFTNRDFPTPVEPPNDVLRAPSLATVDAPDLDIVDWRIEILRQ